MVAWELYCSRTINYVKGPQAPERRLLPRNGRDALRSKLRLHITPIQGHCTISSSYMTYLNRRGTFTFPLNTINDTSSRSCILSTCEPNCSSASTCLGCRTFRNQGRRLSDLKPPRLEQSRSRPQSLHRTVLQSQMHHPRHELQALQHYAMLLRKRKSCAESWTRRIVPRRV